jgi:hypothetical protein
MKHPQAWSPKELQLLRLRYSQGKSVREIANEIGRSRGAVRNKAYDLKITSANPWTAQEIEYLKAHITKDSLASEIDRVADHLGRTKVAVSLKVSRIGLGNPNRKTVLEWKDNRKFKGDKEALRRYNSERTKALWRERGHPKGMAGKHHSLETKNRLRETSKAAWENKTQAEREEWIRKLIKAQKGPPPIKRGSWAAGWREIGGKRNYYRSRWEANYACYLQWLKERGQIADWAHEPETFWFDAIKRGVRSYKPDFRVWENNGKSELHEVKGWMDSRSHTTLKRMAKYHPQETIVLIREKDYNAIARTVGPMIPEWESSNRTNRL